MGLSGPVVSGRVKAWNVLVGSMDGVFYDVFYDVFYKARCRIPKCVMTNRHVTDGMSSNVCRWQGIHPGVSEVASRRASTAAPPVDDTVRDQPWTRLVVQ